MVNDLENVAGRGGIGGTETVGMINGRTSAYIHGIVAVWFFRVRLPIYRLSGFRKSDFRRCVFKSSQIYKSYSNRVKFIWALPGETVEVDGKTEERQLSREFSVATKKTAKLRAFLSSWNSRNYSDDEFLELDLFDQIGKACQLNVVLSDTGEYANVDRVPGEAVRRGRSRCFRSAKSHRGRRCLL